MRTRATNHAITRPLTEAKFNDTKTTIARLHPTLSFREIAKIVELSPGTIYTINRHATFRAYQDYNQSRLGKVSPSPEPTREPVNDVKPEATLTDVFLVLKSIEKLLAENKRRFF